MATNNTSGSSSAAGPSTPAAGGGGRPRGPKMEEEFMVHINLILFGFIGLCVLWRAVGTAARFSQAYEWGTGLLLKSRSGERTTPPPPTRSPSPSMTYRRPVTLKHSPSWSSQTTEFSPASSNDHLEKQDDNESDQSHTYFSHSQQPIVAVGRNGSFKLKHQPSFSTPFATIPEQPYHAQAYRNSGAFSAANYPTRVPSTIFRTLYRSEELV